VASSKLVVDTNVFFSLLLRRDVDPKDAPFVALALHLDAHLWTSDTDLKTGLRAKGFDRFFEP
jgi:predicted nucleic acid-binding protein